MPVGQFAWSTEEPGSIKGVKNTMRITIIRSFFPNVNLVFYFIHKHCGGQNDLCDHFTVF